MTHSPTTIAATPAPLNGPALRRAVRFVSAFVSDDERRPVLMRIEVSFTGEGVWLVATDSYVMGWAYVGEGEPDLSAVPSASHAVSPALLAASIADTDEVRLGFGDEHLTVTGSETLPLKGMDKFPEWRPLARMEKKASISNPRDRRLYMDPRKVAQIASAFDDVQAFDALCDCEACERCDNPTGVRVPFEIEVSADPALPHQFRSSDSRWALLMGVLQ